MRGFKDIRLAVLVASLLYNLMYVVGLVLLKMFRLASLEDFAVLTSVCFNWGACLCASSALA
ncbi:MAG: hypothetical protein R2865_13020 [Deinococcales bacterium]